MSGNLEESKERSKVIEQEKKAERIIQTDFKDLSLHFFQNEDQSNAKSLNRTLKMIVLKVKDEIIGNIEEFQLCNQWDLRKRELIEDYYNLDIWFYTHEEKWKNQGFMTYALRIYLNDLFTEFGNKIYVETNVANEASKKVHEKLGFICRNTFTFKLTKENFEKNEAKILKEKSELKLVSSKENFETTKTTQKEEKNSEQTELIKEEKKENIDTNFDKIKDLGFKLNFFEKTIGCFIELFLMLIRVRKFQTNESYTKDYDLKNYDTFKNAYDEANTIANKMRFNNAKALFLNNEDVSFCPFYKFC